MMNVRLGYSGANVTTGELVGSDLAEQMMATAAEYGRPIPNASKHTQLADANKTLQNVVRIDLDRRFGEFVNQATAEIEDRVSIRQRSLIRHFEKKIATLKEQQENLNNQALTAEAIGDARKARNLKNLATAQEARIGKLRLTWRLREDEIEAQRLIAPEESEVACVFLLIEESNSIDKENTS